MRTEEIAEVLGADPDSVATSRDEALRRVARDVGLGEDNLDEVRARLAELPAAEWLGGTRGSGARAEAAAPTVEEPATQDEPITEQAREQPAAGAARKPSITPGARRRRSVWPALLALLLLGGVIVAIAVAAGSGDEDEGGGGKQAQRV